MHDDLPDTDDSPDAWPPGAWPARDRAVADAPRYVPDDNDFYRRALGLAMLVEHRPLPLRPAQEDLLIQLIELQEADAGPGSLLPHVVQALLTVAAWPCWDRELAAISTEPNPYHPPETDP